MWRTRLECCTHCSGTRWESTHATPRTQEHTLPITLVSARLMVPTLPYILFFSSQRGWCIRRESGIRSLSCLHIFFCAILISDVGSQDQRSSFTRRAGHYYQSTRHRWVIAFWLSSKSFTESIRVGAVSVGQGLAPNLPFVEHLAGIVSPG